MPRRREIALPLAAPRKRLARLGGGRPGVVRLHGAELTLLHPGAMQAPLTLPGGYVALATVDRGSTRAEHGRFPILHRLTATAVIPQEHGIEGWLWTTRQGSALPAVGDEDLPNLALLFVKPLDPALVEAHFRPEWVRAVAERSPLGAPAVPGLLLSVESASAAEDAFRQFGVLKELTDREVPPVMRRHLPGDKPANPAVGGSAVDRARTSVAPPGFR
jgi:hypothetical protein